MNAAISRSYGDRRYRLRMADLSDAQNARVRRILNEMLTDRKAYPTKLSLAKALHIAGPSLNAILNRGGGVSYPTASRLAQLRGVTVEDLIGPAREPRARLVTVEGDDRYPSRSAVLNDPSNAGRWDAPAIAAARSYALDSDDDPGESFWVRVLDSFQVTARGLEFALPKSRTEEVDLDDL